MPGVIREGHREWEHTRDWGSTDLHRRPHAPAQAAAEIPRRHQVERDTRILKIALEATEDGGDFGEVTADRVGADGWQRLDQIVAIEAHHSLEERSVSARMAAHACAG